MKRKFRVRILLLFLILLVGGCWYGGSGTYHRSISTLRCDEPWVIHVQYQKDPKDWRYKLTEECASFIVHYRDSLSDDFLVVPLVIEKMDLKAGTADLKAELPPIPCRDGIEYVEYYYDHIFPSYIYNRSKMYQVIIRQG